MKPTLVNGVPIGADPPKPEAALYRLLPSVVLCVSAIAAVAILWYPIARIGAHIEVNYNEGWNAYKQAMVAHGTALYGLPPTGFTGATSYPPVSFYIVSWLGRWWDYTFTGRWLSLFSLIAAGCFVALIVRREGASRLVSVYSFLLYVIGIAVLSPLRVGMNDPQLLGEALTLAGLYLYVLDPRRHSMLCLSAIAFCLAGFTKQNLVAFPVAAGLDLLITSRQRFVVFATVMVGAAVALTAVIFLVDGPFFLDHLTIERAYSFKDGWHTNTHIYLLTIQAPLLLGILGTMCQPRRRIVLTIGFAASHLLGFLFAGGDGVSRNILFNAFASVVILCGVALADAEAAVADARVMPIALRLRGLLMFAALLGVLFEAPGYLRTNRDAIRQLHAWEYEWRSATELMKSRPGPALCESLLLCYEAGKPFEFDAFWVSDAIRMQRIEETRVVALLAAHYFQTVQINISEGEANEPTDLVIRHREELEAWTTTFDGNMFSGRLMQAVSQNYQAAYRDSQILIFRLRD